MKPKPDVEWRLDELAKEAGTSARTVRYYVQRGLLPPPIFRGKDSAYGARHLARLRAIQKMQSAFFPLDAIKSVIDLASEEEVARIAEGHVPAAGETIANEAAPSTRGHGSPAHAPKKSDYHRVERVEKIALFPGVEIFVSDAANDAAKKFVQRMIEQAEKAEKENAK